MPIRVRDGHNSFGLMGTNMVCGAGGKLTRDDCAGTSVVIQTIVNTKNCVVYQMDKNNIQHTVSTQDVKIIGFHVVKGLPSLGHKLDWLEQKQRNHHQVHL